jgi:hypothetical protein
MLQANPALTPNLVKAILQYTAQVYPGYRPLEQGAGFLNTYGAVKLAKFYRTARVGDSIYIPSTWSRQVIWGNHLLKHGFISPSANAWGTSVLWGSAKTQVTDGDNIVWGTSLGDGDNIVWGTSLGDGDNIVWGTSLGDGDNIVWGTDCGGADCGNVVWGSSDGDNIVWGTSTDGDNIVWGTSLGDGDNIVWGTSLGDGDNIVWGTSDDSNLDAVFPDADPSEQPPSITAQFGEPPTGGSTP